LFEFEPNKKSKTQKTCIEILREEELKNKNKNKILNKIISEKKKLCVG
jgi:hypothetical protein